LPSLIKLWPTVLYVEYFLHGHYVGIEFGVYGCNTPRGGTPVDTLAFVYFVGDAPDVDSHC
jgi:hypothetical protein